ncbi:Antitoxin PemI [Cedecea lapagei]|uniref:Antitoxin PemI n=1 Tax=Cedecea lapagei TaxID=158823 RepID=A0A447V0D3_9ENTR|nr:Antitoxin PemI [Cedecea lapagei]
MYTARLKKVGGSIMLAVPPALLKTLELTTDSEVSMTIFFAYAYSRISIRYNPNIVIESGFNWCY